MRTVEFDAPGDPDVLHLVEVEPPEPAEDEVVIEVVSAGMNFADLLQRRGVYGLKSGAVRRLGLECSGRVVAMGRKVQGFQLGDDVCALLPGGTYAERVAVDASLVLPVPEGASVLDAGALPEMVATVWSNLIDIGGLERGQDVLIHGGGGGIGSGAIQIAKAIGARVITTCGSEEKAAFCKGLGADVVVNYRESDFVEDVNEATDGRGVDVVLDSIGAPYLQRNVDATGMDGRIVMIGVQGGKLAEVDLGTMMEKRMSLHVTSLRDRPLAERARIMEGVRQLIWPMVAENRLRPLVDRVFEMEDVVEAHRYAESGAQKGKILLQMRG